MIPVVELAAQQFAATTRALDERELRAPSRLPGWSRAHVIAHVVLNAEGFCDAARGLASDGLGLMYPAGVAARDEAIVRLAEASLGELVARLDAAHADFIERWNPPPAAGPCTTAPDTPRFQSSTVPGRRLRELQVHLVDLGVDGVTHDAWLDEFVDHDLPLQWPTVHLRTSQPIDVVDEHGTRWRANTAKPAPVQCVRRDLLAWTLDRAHIDDLPTLAEWGNRSRWEHTELR